VKMHGSIKKTKMINLIISSTFISDPIKTTLAFWLEKAQLQAQISFAPYNQIIQHLLDPHSKLNNNQQGINVLLLRFEDWCDSHFNLEHLSHNLEQFKVALAIGIKHSQSRFLVSLCPSTHSLFHQLEQQLLTELNTMGNVSVFSSKELLSLYPVKHFHSNFGNELSHIPYKESFFVALGTLIARKIIRIVHRPYKVIVLDCDNTLWKGVCAERGYEGVTVPPSYQALQIFMLKQREQGLLLCLCSKNNEEDVFDVLAKNSHMLIKKEHVSAYRINWENKSKNIIALSQELQLGLESFVFLDDNPLECAEVRAHLPEVLTVQLPKKEQQVTYLLQHFWFLDPVKLTQEDKNRALSYQQNSQREQFKIQTLNLKEFIKGLGLTIQIQPISPNDVPRVVQLTQRTNQFNLTNLRRSEGDILYLAQKNIEGYSVRVSDRFGDYGLVGVLFFQIKERRFVLDTFLLSCRVLGRGIEHAMVSWLGQQALQRNIDYIEFPYQQTPRNKPVWYFLQSLSVFKSPYSLSAQQAAKISFEPDVMPYFEAISSDAGTAVIPDAQQTSQWSFIELLLELNSLEKIQQAIQQHFLKSREDLKLIVDYTAPQNEAEQRMIQIWEDSICINPIGITDNFFYLGGNSLLAAQVLTAIYEAFHIQLQMTDLYNHPTIKTLLSFIKKTAQNTKDREILINKETKSPLSFGQKRLWFLDRLITNKQAYNVAVTLKLSGELHFSLLQKALDFMLKNHAILRAQIKENAGEPFQEILSASSLVFPLAYEDLRHDASSLPGKIKNQIEEQFQLNRWPLIRANLFQCSKQEYVFSLVTHHIIIDAQSLDIFFSELFQIYQTLLNDTTVTLRMPSIEYSDYALWQEEQLTQISKTQKGFWQEYLYQAPYIQLPHDKQRPEQLTHQGAVCTNQIDPIVLDQLRGIAKTHQTTLFVVLLSAFQALLFRLTGQQDLVIGIPIALRNHPETHNLLGFFVNTLALRCKLNCEAPFTQTLESTKHTFLSAYENKDIPFEQVVDSLFLKRSLNQHPLFSVMYTHKQERSINQLERLKVEFLDSPTHSSLFDLTLTSEETQNGLKLSIEYAQDLFYQDTIERILTHLSDFVRTMAAHPHKSIIDLWRSNQTEELKILAGLNKTQYQLPPYQIIHQWFKHQAQNRPDAIAISFNLENKQISYGQLEAQASQLAFSLQQNYGVQAGAFIPICMEPCISYFISILAVLKVGCAYVPIDPDYPLERISFILKDVNAHILISDRPYSGFEGNILQLDDNWEQVPTQYQLIESECNSSDIACIIYTSGSTGQPKGVLLEHGSICNIIHWHLTEQEIGFNDRILQLSSLCFDASIFDWAGALLSGATLYLTSKQTKRNPEQIVALCNQHQITQLLLTPSMLSTLPDVPLPYLKIMIIGGELCSDRLLSEWMQKIPLIINAYGPTEATIISSFQVCQKDQAANIIGRPITNTECYILDDQQQPMPMGMIGELYIGGLGLARGYLNRDDLTQSSFLQTPFGRLYKTGDLGRFLPDGLHYLGRKDHQVKIRGQRVELGEIEHALSLDSQVNQAVVLVNNNSQLIAYLVLKNTRDKMSELLKIHRALEQKLPSYLLPSGFVLLDKMPLLLTGKADRRALADQEYPILHAQDGFIAPRNETEWALSQLFKKLLKVSAVSREDDFFQIGGNSLLMVQLATTIQQRFHQTIPLDVLYTKPTIAHIGKILHSGLIQTREIDATDLFPIQTQGDLIPLFLIHPSFGLALPYWGLSAYFEDRPIYGLSNPYFNDLNKQFTSLKEMACKYIKVIQKIQKQGPYLLAGWSFGGVVAFEMAQQLQQMGKEVNQVILIDSFHPQTTQTIKEDFFLKQEQIDPLSTEGQLFKIEIEHNIELLKKYTPNPYQGTVTLLKAQASQKVNQKWNGWETTITPVPQVYNLSGQHEQLFNEKHLKSTAKQLKDIIL
jgi:amino acid adenylation domain-containing protein/FkbH-like protein